VAAAHTQHFGEAADRIGVSQPTLSQALSSLKSNLRSQLVERKSRYVIVTPEGESLLPLARRSVEAAQ